MIALCCPPRRSAATDRDVATPSTSRNRTPDDLFERHLDEFSDNLASDPQASSDRLMRLFPDRQQQIQALLNASLDEPVATQETLPPILPRQTWLPARRIDHFQLHQCLGIGGMGEVYHATSERLAGPVALKLVRFERRDSGLSQRFRREASCLASLRHPNIVRWVETGEGADGEPYLAMERIVGVDLLTHHRDHALSLLDSLESLVQVADAMAYTHRQGIVHCDLKPDNILITKRHGRSVAKLIDFGLAKRMDEQPIDAGESIGRPERLTGTLPYMSPEQARLQSRDIDPRSDLFSLGAILFELITGRTPLGKLLSGKALLTERLQIVRNQRAVRPSLVVGGHWQGCPRLLEHLDNVCTQAMAYRPEDRFATASEFAQSLTDAVRAVS
ncbi:MAG: serine/threonine-protein kinase [Planctomycetota bacterium]